MKQNTELSKGVHISISFDTRFKNMSKGDAQSACLNYLHKDNLFVKYLVQNTQSQDLEFPNSKIHYLMESFSQIAIRYLAHIILNKKKLEKKQAPIPHD